jgi:hypothetical protein
MAIDTEQKRAASFIDDCGIKIPPSGSFIATDRAWMVGQYLFAGALTIPSFPNSATLSHTGADVATLVRSGVNSATLARTGPNSATLGPRTS